MGLLFLSYAAVACVVVFVSIKCADYVDLIDKKTNMSGAFIGGVILAAVTSLPELITSITAVTVVKNPGLIMGNVLGSNVFNLLIFGVLCFFTMKSFVTKSISKSHKITIICTLVAYAVVIAVMNFDYAVLGVSYGSVLILILYIVSLKFMASDDSENDEEDTSKLTLKQIIIRFILAAIMLVIGSVLITYITDKIATGLNLNASLAGALFLGIATSLPELSSSVALVKKRNYNAMTGNIMGSNMFNYLILVVGDILYNKESIFVISASHQTNMLIVFGAISSVATLITLFTHSSKKKSKPVLYIFTGVIIISYILFLVFSM
ncbi:MAG: cation transporter [Oscillospiraceae bacterium]